MSEETAPKDFISVLEINKIRRTINTTVVAQKDSTEKLFIAPWGKAFDWINQISNNFPTNFFN